MTLRAEKFVSLAIALVVLLFIVWLSHYGPSHRVYQERQRAVAVGHVSEAYSVWNGAGIKGRILYLFDSKLNAKKTGDGSITPESYIYRAAMGNIIREIHHVMPEAVWSRASAALEANKSVAKRDGAYRFTLDSTPVIVTNLANIGSFKEKALVVINPDAWEDGELSGIIGLVKSGRLGSDIVVVAGEKAETVLNGAGMDYER